MDTDPENQFDFWLGEWEAPGEKGKEKKDLDFRGGVFLFWESKFWGREGGGAAALISILGVHREGGGRPGVETKNGAQRSLQLELGALR